MQAGYSEKFAQFWLAYPRHVGKKDAWKAFQKLTPTDADVRVMVDALNWQREQPQWRKDGGLFVPYPASWLNGRRWEDEPFHVEPTRPRSLGPIYKGWECPHTPKCEQRHWCELKSAQEVES